ncbi:sirohydrochlorin chelatase, partial [Streptomyces bambusae]|nr:sirohydrochlorin chelatase [Streptomyces bambusae]
ASYFAAPGRFATQCAAAAPALAAAPLGDHPALARLVLHRYDQALAGRLPGLRLASGHRPRPELATA